ncbi:MAG TPA: hypothetical protein VK718_11250 [Ferruginibacter sp.]|jgi:hypothetical protein|nr:hypothetical protein [Ferruginibacter sp.]
MKKYSKAILLMSILLIGLNVLPYVSSAQVPAGQDPDSAPIDGGISLLVAAGIGYGIKKNKDRKKSKEIDM